MLDMVLELALMETVTILLFQSTLLVTTVTLALKLILLMEMETALAQIQ